jgi:RNA polymerase-binding protein DksA
MSRNGTLEGFTRNQLEQFETALLERRQLLLNDFQALEAAEARDASHAASASTHLADLGSDRAASDISLGCRESASGEIQQIDEALERILDGSFGLCETCDKRISEERLGAIPYARLCLSCKKREEL